MKNHGCEAYSSQLWHVFFTTVEKAYHSRAHMINPKALKTNHRAKHNRSLCNTQRKPMQETRKPGQMRKKTVSTLPGKNGSSQ